MGIERFSTWVRNGVFGEDAIERREYYYFDMDTEPSVRNALVIDSSSLSFYLHVSAGCNSVEGYDAEVFEGALRAFIEQLLCHGFDLYFVFEGWAFNSKEQTRASRSKENMRKMNRYMEGTFTPDADSTFLMDVDFNDDMLEDVLCQMQAQKATGAPNCTDKRGRGDLGSGDDLGSGWDTPGLGLRTWRTLGGAVHYMTAECEADGLVGHMARTLERSGHYKDALVFGNDSDYACMDIRGVVMASAQRRLVFSFPSRETSSIRNFADMSATEQARHVFTKLAGHIVCPSLGAASVAQVQVPEDRHGTCMVTVLFATDAAARAAYTLLSAPGSGFDWSVEWGRGGEPNPRGLDLTRPCTGTSRGGVVSGTGRGGEASASAGGDGAVGTRSHIDFDIVQPRKIAQRLCLRMDQMATLAGLVGNDETRPMLAEDLARIHAQALYDCHGERNGFREDSLSHGVNTRLFGRPLSQCRHYDRVTGRGCRNGADCWFAHGKSAAETRRQIRLKLVHTSLHTVPLREQQWALVVKGVTGGAERQPVSETHVQALLDDNGVSSTVVCPKDAKDLRRFVNTKSKQGLYAILRALYILREAGYNAKPHKALREVLDRGPMVAALALLVRRLGGVGERARQHCAMDGSGASGAAASSVSGALAQALHDAQMCYDLQARMPRSFSRGDSSVAARWAAGETELRLPRDLHANLGETQVSALRALELYNSGALRKSHIEDILNAWSDAQRRPFMVRRSCRTPSHYARPSVYALPQELNDLARALLLGANVTVQEERPGLVVDQGGMQKPVLDTRMFTTNDALARGPPLPALGTIHRPFSAASEGVRDLCREAILARLGSSASDFDQLCDEVYRAIGDTFTVDDRAALPNPCRLASLPLLLLIVRFWAMESGSTQLPSVHDPLHASEVGVLLACALRGVVSEGHRARSATPQRPSCLASHRQSQYRYLLRAVRDVHDLLCRPLAPGLRQRAAEYGLSTATDRGWFPSELCGSALNGKPKDKGFLVNDARTFYACYRALHDEAQPTESTALHAAGLIEASGSAVADAAGSVMFSCPALHAKLCDIVLRAVEGCLSPSWDEVQHFRNPQIWREPAAPAPPQQSTGEDDDWEVLYSD